MTKPDYDCSRVVEIEDEPRHHLVIANDFVRAFAVEIAPGERTLCHRHPNHYLLYVALGSEIISAARDEKPKQLNYRDGECEMSAAGLIHVVENLGDAPFRNVVVELLPRAGAQRRVVIRRALPATSKLERFLTTRGQRSSRLNSSPAQRSRFPVQPSWRVPTEMS